MKFLKGDQLRKMQLYVKWSVSSSDCRQASGISILDSSRLEIIWPGNSELLLQHEILFLSERLQLDSSYLDEISADVGAFNDSWGT